MILIEFDLELNLIVNLLILAAIETDELEKNLQFGLKILDNTYIRRRIW